MTATRAPLLWLTAGLLGASALWLLFGLSGNISFILTLRLEKLAALGLVGASVGVATILFQSVYGNRLLTPSIMGLDALYQLVQTALVVLLGTTAYVTLPHTGKFLAETAVMGGLAIALFSTLLTRSGSTHGGIARMILTGVILGVLFRSLNSFLGRLMDPDAFAVVQSVSFANFSRPETDLLGIAGAVCAVFLWIAWGLRRHFDVMALGREAAIPLGLRYRLIVLIALSLSAGLTAISTALVGPVAFFGLLVSGLAHGALPSKTHSALLPAAALIGALLLIAGQFVFERILGLAATLSVVIEFAGGLLFLTLLIKGKIR